jgi:hypothetical protein
MRTDRRTDGRTNETILIKFDTGEFYENLQAIPVFV